MIDKLMIGIEGWLGELKEGESLCRKQWFFIGEGESKDFISIRFYMRTVDDFISEESMMTCMDILALEIKPSSKALAIFDSFIERLEEVNPCNYLYLESLEDFLCKNLIRNGWEKKKDKQLSYYKLMKDHSRVKEAVH